MKRARPIIITGFMGSGKSTVAQALARLLGCPALDLDQLITEQTGRTPKVIIEQYGEPAFREVETRVLGEIFAEGSARVIALGGGTWTIEKNRDLVAQHAGFSVWLDAPFELCWERIAQSGSERPLAPTRGSALSLYDLRRSAYVLSTIRIAVTAKKAVDSVAEEIRQSVPD